MSIQNISINAKIILAFGTIALVLGGGFFFINEQNTNVSMKLTDIQNAASQTTAASEDAININNKLKNNVDGLFSKVATSLSLIQSGATATEILAKKAEATNALLTRTISDILDKYNPAILKAQAVKEQVTNASMNLGFYLLMKTDAQKALFADALALAQSSIAEIKLMETVLESDDSIEYLLAVESDFNILMEKKSDLDLYVSKRDANMPSVAYASLQLNPKNRSITSILSAMIDSGGASENDDTNKEFVDLLIEMRHYQVSGSGDIRAYLALRNKSIDSADALYASVKEGMDKVLQLVEADEELIDMEFEEDWARVVSNVNEINTTNLSELRRLHSSDKWRMDVHTLNTEVNPLVVSLQENLEGLIEEQEMLISEKTSAMTNAIQSANNGIANILDASIVAITNASSSTMLMSKGSIEVNKDLTATTASLGTIKTAAESSSAKTIESNEAMASVDNIVLSVIGAFLAAIVVILMIIRSSISVPIQNGIRILNNISEGNLDDELDATARKDEIGQMLNSMAQIKGNLQKFNGELSDTVEAAKSGDLSKVIDSESYKGYMADQADQINYLVHTVKSVLDGINTSLTGLANGDLDVSMDVSHYEGQYQVAAKSVNFTLENITLLVQGIQSVVGTALQGDLTGRVDNDTMAGYSLEISQSINHLMEMQDKVFADIVAVMESLSNKDLTSLINNDLDGNYASIRDNNNEAQTDLSKLFVEIATAAIKVSEQAQKMNIGNAELASRSEQQASYLEETSSAMEEFTASIQTNATNAKNASEVSTTASTTAAEGGKAVQEVADTVSEVSEAFEEIASTVGIIDDIAFQTNILALNAAVEAARAGDHGRGFAVVAQEVRNLAQRSAESARNIKELVDNRAKSVTMATQLAEKAGDTMIDIVTSITEVSALVQEISIASSEQADGVTQVNDAISRLDEMTQQNSHLVDGNNVVAQALNLQSEELKAQVMGFNFLGKDKIDSESSFKDSAEDEGNIFSEGEDPTLTDDDFNDNPFNPSVS